MKPSSQTFVTASRAGLALAAVFAVTACGNSPDKAPTQDSIPTSPEIAALSLGHGMTYSPETNSVHIATAGLEIENPAALSLSKSGRAAIYAAADVQSGIEVYAKRPAQELLRLTDNQFKEAYPVINDDGRYAYLLYDHLTGTQTIFLDSAPLVTADSKVELRHLALTAHALAYVREDRATDQQFLTIYNLGTSTDRQVSVPGIVLSMVAYGDDHLILHVLDSSTWRSRVIDYAFDSHTLNALRDSPVNQFPSFGDAGELIVTEVDGEPRTVALFSALYAWRSQYLANAFAYGNNFLGDITWNAAYVIEALVNFHEITGREIFQIQLVRSIDAILSATNAQLMPWESRVPGFLWATRKYSMDKAAPLDLLVSDSRILYALLLAANRGLLDEKQAAAVIEIAGMCFDYFEQQFDEAAGIYRIRYGSPFWADGVWAPFNWQHAWGLVLIELYRATGEDIYRERAVALAERFRAEWEMGADGAALWHYWPAEFYMGWEAKDGVSMNTPSWPAADDALYEDGSHAGISIKFLLEYRDVIGDEPFSDADVDSIARTIERLLSAGKFSRFISGDVSHTPVSYRYLPLYGWSELKHSLLQRYHLAPVPNAGSLGLLAQTAAIGTGAVLGCEIQSISYDDRLAPSRSDRVYLDSDRIPGYFGLD